MQPERGTTKEDATLPQVLQPSLPGHSKPPQTQNINTHIPSESAVRSQAYPADTKTLCPVWMSSSLGTGHSPGFLAYDVPMGTTWAGHPWKGSLASDNRCAPQRPQAESSLPPRGLGVTLEKAGQGPQRTEWWFRIWAGSEVIHREQET